MLLQRQIDSLFLIGIYALVIAWWITIYARGIEGTSENYLFSLLYSGMPLGWGIIGFMRSRSWGGFSSSMGRAVFFLSAGIFAWGIGNLIFGYYNLILKVEIPYPSLADMGFVLLYPLSAIGVLYLSRATGALSKLRSLTGKVILLIIPVCMMFLSYYLLVTIARDGVITKHAGDLLKVILDVAYPIGDVITITLASIVYALSFRQLGGVFRTPVILILLSFVSFYFADFLFSYTTTVGTYFVGKWVDIFYPTAFVLIGLGLSLLSPNIVSESVND